MGNRAQPAVSRYGAFELSPPSLYFAERLRRSPGALRRPSRELVITGESARVVLDGQTLRKSHRNVRFGGSGSCERPHRWRDRGEAGEDSECQGDDNERDHILHECRSVRNPPADDLRLDKVSL